MRKIILLCFILVFLTACGKTLDYQECLNVCQEENYDYGTCLWPEEKTNNMDSFGNCLITESNHCSQEGQCQCFCEHIESETF